MKQPSIKTLRRMAKQQGYRLTKSWQAVHANNHGEWMLIDLERNCVVCGSKFDANEMEIAQFLGIKPE